MIKNLHCPHINPNGKPCDNILRQYDENTVLVGTQWCRKCKTAHHVVIANGKVYEIEEAVSCG